MLFLYLYVYVKSISSFKRLIIARLPLTFRWNYHKNEVIYISETFCRWLKIYKNQGPYLLKKNFQVFWKILSFKFVMIFNESFCNVCFLIANSPRIYSGKLLILIYYPKIFSTNQNAGFSKLTQKYTWDNGAVRLIFFLVTRHS